MRGGKRKGAGRKSDLAGVVKKTLSVKLDPDIIERLRSESDGKPGPYIEKVLRDLFFGPVPEVREIRKSRHKERIFEAIRKWPGADRQVLISVRELRIEFPNIAKEDFDSSVMRLAGGSDPPIFVHRHIHPYRMTEQDKKDFVADDKGNYYVGVVYRQESSMMPGAG
jgi:hypothetical protein